MESAVAALLAENNIVFEVIEIPLTEDEKPIRELEAWLVSQGKKPDSVVRSLLFKTPSGAFVLLAAPGGRRADWAILRKHLGERKLRMAEFDEVSEATGYVVGAVPPIALPDGVRVLVDNQVAEYDEVIIGSGVLGYAFSLASTDLVRLLGNIDQGDFLKVDA